jgi:NADH dehydrogenase FAD-containing subunit
MKTINDVFVLRNYIINILRQATLESNYKSNLIYPLLTFVIVDGGFNGIKNVGELNHFVKDVIKDTYYNLDSSKIKLTR